MSEGDVSLISDEDVLRRMWQQTEDFGRKKEIRSHMYRLREERLRNLYSPGSQPTLDGKGCEFSSSPGHLRSFADQSFQSMKSKEVRDAGSPPKDFEYRGQDLKELSNAGWNVESENRITDDGHTQIRAVQANIEGRYDVEGGKGQFAAIDQNKQSVTEYHDDNTSLKRKENSSHAAAHEQVMRHTDDGSHFSSTTSSSTSTSKFKQTSSTKHETVPYATNNKYDISQPTSEINDNVEEIKRSKINDYEQSLRKSDYDQAELVSRKVEYPDDNTKIVIETRCLPDGTRVTSTRREFRGPAVNTNYSEHQSQKIRKENKSFMTSSQKRSDVRQTSRITDEFIDDQIHDIVDSQRIIDDKDFNKVYHTNEKIQTTDTKKIVHNQDSRNSHHVDRHTYNTVESNDEFDVLKTPINDDNASDITCTIINNNDTIRKQSANYSKVCKDEYKQTMKNTADTRTSNITDQHSITPTTDCDRYVPNEPQNKDNRAYVKKTNDIETYKISKDIEDINSKISTDKIVEEIIDKKVTSDQHQTTYQTDFIQNKISTEWSPTHQAWASTLRADTPPTTRPSTRASSPGSRTFKSSTSSLRSSVSPDKTVKKPGSRGTSPIKRTTTSPSRTTTQKNSHTHITNTVTKEVTNRYTSPERKQPHGSSPTRYSVSPDRKPQVDFRSKSNISPEKHHDRKTSPTNDLPSTIRRDTTPTRYNQSPEKHKQLTSDNPTILSYPNNSVRPSLSPERKPPTGFIRKSPEKKPQPPKISTPTLPRSVVPEVRPYRKSDNEELTKPTDFKEHSPPRSFNRDESKDVKGSDSSNAYSTRPNSDRKSTNKHDSTIVVNKTSEIKTTIKTNEDNYELVNQNISTHYHNVEDNKDFKKRIPTSDDINTLKSSFIQTPTKINSQSPTPPGARPTLRTTSRSPSPPKGSVTFTSTEEFDVKCLDEVDRTKQIHSTITNISATDVSKDNRNRLRSPKDNEITSTTSKNKTPVRETSPTKYTTYDNKQQRTEEIKDSITPMSSDSRDDKFTRREKSPKSFSESQESPNKFSTDRDGVSPSKSSPKYSHNSDFINTERKTEEINKKTKDRPRQLVTPSTSPTRKPAGRDNAPSTGQSSPTTSVSGFVYFSSPNTEKNVTNYDEDLYTENEKNEYTTKNIRETPSKLPCKPPLPRQGSPSKEALPRKSSLKKPTESIIQLPSPTEKPPTTFLISPTEPNVSEQKIVKKDQPIDKTISERSKPKSPIKQKPPLERRETYEERCRKILGMMDSSNEKSTESIVPQSDVQKHSPSISPCCSPELKEDLPFSDFSSKTIKKDIKSNITDFIKHEQREITKATKQKDNARPLSRDTSPTKLKDILVPQNENTENPTFTTDTDANFEETIKSQNINRKSNRMSLSPERKLRNPSLTKEVVEETKHSRTPSPTKNTRYINEKPKTKVIDHCTDENEFVLKNSIKQISSEIHRETPSLRPDKQIYACFPQNSSVINVIKNSFEESKQTYNISEKSSDIIHQTIKKSDEPHSKTPSPSKNYKATEYIIRDKATTHKIPQVQPKALNQKQGEPIKSRTPSPSKSVLKTPGDHETVPKYLSEKPYDRKVKEKPKESIHSRTSSPTKNVTKITDCYTEEKNEYTSRREIKQSDMLGKITPMNKSQRPERSRTPSPTKTMTKVIEYTTNVNEGEITTNISNHPSEVAQNNYPKQKLNEPTHSSTPLTNKSVVKDTNEYTIRHDNIEAPRILGKDSLISNPNEPIHSRTPSPTKSFTVTKRDTEEIDCLTSSIHQGISETTNDNISTTILKETSRSRTPSPTKPMAKEIKNSIANKPSDVPSPGKFSPTQKIKETNTYNTPLSTKTKQQTHSPRIPTQKSDKTSKLTYAKKPVKPTDLDTIESDARKTKFTEESEKFIVTEREQEIFVQQQKSLKNSPHERRHKSPTPPCNNRFNVEYSTTEESFETTANNSLHKLTDKNNCKQDKPRDQSIPSKLPSRNISPTKKTNNANPTRPEITPESPTKSRSMSPRKPMSPIGRPQSPQIPKGNVSKSKEPVGLNKIGVTSEINKITNTTKQNSFTKTSTNKNISKFSSANKPSETFSKSNVSKKESEIKITRTTNDINKKPSSQKTRSKPEIQVTAVTSKYTKQKTTKPKNQSHKEPQTKKIEKPKSATALNTSTDDEDVLVDVQQAKSSRENSPDRICPTPVNILDDSGTPRFPDEVKEPDDDFRRRTHHTIHETETIVDDIVEISEDDELFVKNSKRVDKLDESSLGVNNEVNPKDGTKHFKTTKNRIQTDLIDENSKSDEYLLSVSEKVNKFAKGPKDTKDCKSPSRRVVEEYDTDTVYQDNYTKLSVNDKANLFIQTAEKIKSPTTKVPQKAERPDLNDIDDSLKSDDCLLSVSDKVNKFVKTAEQFLTETNETEEKEKKIKEKHEIIMKSIVQESDNENNDLDVYNIEMQRPDRQNEKLVKQNEGNLKIVKKNTMFIPQKSELSTPSAKPIDRTPTVKITTLRSSEAVKKAKALFENIASTTHKLKDHTTKLTDIGVNKKTTRTISTIAHHPSVEESATDGESDVDISQSPTPKEYPTGTLTKQCYPNNEKLDNKRRSSPSRPTSSNSEVPRSGTPSHYNVEEFDTTKTVISRYPERSKSEIQKHSNTDADKPNKPHDYVPGYLRPTKTSQIREETKTVEENTISGRRGSGKFGIELRRTSTDRTSVSSEGRHSIDLHQPCVEDIFDVDLLEQMLEKVNGYEQRRRIRAQIRIAKKQSESSLVDTNTYTKTVRHMTPKNKSPERQAKPSPQRILSPDHAPNSKLSKPMSPDRFQPKETSKPMSNGHSKETIKKVTDKPSRLHSPEKNVSKSKTRSPVRNPSPEKKPTSISSTTSKSKTGRFNEYATAYMKKVGINESDKSKLTDKTKKVVEIEDHEISQNFKEFSTMKTESTSITKTLNERITSKDTFDEVNITGNRSSSPEKRRSPMRQPESPTDRLYRSPSPELKRPKTESLKKETTIKTAHNIEKKIQPKPAQEDKPSWVTNRNLKKLSSETRTFNNKKVENEKPKYRAPSPSKVISKPTDVITSSYGPGPLDADGRPLFGIKALRHGATNYQVKGTVIRQEYHSKNGGEPEGTVSVTAYSTEPQDLETLISVQGERPSRLHGLAAITTTKKFGGSTGTTIKEAHSKEERASLEQFTHSDRKVTHVDSRALDATELRSAECPRPLEPEQSTKVSDRRQKGVTHRVEDVTHKMEERKQKKGQPVRQSSVKSLTEKFIKNATESSRAERSSYPKAGLILRTTTTRGSISSDSSNHAGLCRTDSEHSLASADDETVVTTVEEGDGRRVTTTTTTRHHQHHAHGHGHGHTQESFLDSNTKVTGVQDILTRMKNADIVITEGDSSEDAEARALLNKFLGASVLMAGVQAHVERAPPAPRAAAETVRSGGGRVSSERSVQEFDLDQCWDERVLRKLLEECADYEQRRRLRARIRTLMAEQEACATAVTDAVAGAAETSEPASADETREEEEVTVTSSVRRNSSEKTVSSSTTTKTSKVFESAGRPAARAASKPVSPFAKFRQLEKQNSTNTPNSPSSPGSPGSPQSPGSPAPYFKFTDPALQASAVTIKERLLQWCRDKTRDYENVKLENFSTSWADGLAFCALVHHFLPTAFDYSALTPDRRRHNFTLAFKVADEKAGIYPLLDVDDMVAMRKPDWKCVFTYVQSIHRRFKDQN